jgi:site-specific recombinase XerD
MKRWSSFGLPGTQPENGADIAQIQALLGHRSADTTGRRFRAARAELVALFLS